MGSAALFTNPHDVATNGAIFAIAEFNGHKIRIALPNGTVTTLAGGGGGVLSGSSDGVGSNALFMNPNGVAFEAGGTVLVADSNGNRVRRVWLNGTVTTLVGGGATGALAGSADGSGTGAMGAMFAYPSGIAVPPPTPGGPWFYVAGARGSGWPLFRVGRRQASSPPT